MALMSAIPQAIAPNSHTNLLHLYIQIANKMGFQQTKKYDVHNILNYICVASNGS
jgi:hypothetical protein